MAEHSSGPWEQTGTIIWSPSSKAVVCNLSEPYPDGYLVKHQELRLGSQGWDEAMANGSLVITAPALLALVEAVEWVHLAWGGMMCAWCKGIYPNHAPDCRRQRALARVRGEGNEVQA